MCFSYLEAPVLRVTNRDVPQPYATILEKTVMPTTKTEAKKNKEQNIQHKTGRKKNKNESPSSRRRAKNKEESRC